MKITEVKNIVKKVISEVTSNTPPLDINSITFEDLKKIGADTLPSPVNSTTQIGIKSEKDLDNYKQIFIKKFGNATLNLDKDQPWYAKVTITGNQKFDEFKAKGSKAADKFYNSELKYKND